MAEGRGKAQAATLRKTRGETVARVRRADGRSTRCRRRSCELGDLCVVTAGEVIPGDGDVDRGHRHRRRVGHHRRVGAGDPRVRRRPLGRHRRHPVLSDEIVVRITAKPGETFLDRMIALVEGADRQKTPNEIALSILLAGLTIIFLLAVVTLQPFAIYSGAEQSIIVLVALLVCLIPTTIGGLLSAIGIAGMDRLVQRNVLAMSGRAVEAAGDVTTLLLDKTGHDHVRRPPGGRVPAGARRHRAASWPRRRWRRASPTRRRRVARSSSSPSSQLRARRAVERRECRAGAVHRPDPDERHGLPGSTATAGRSARAPPRRSAGCVADAGRHRAARARPARRRDLATTAPRRSSSPIRRDGEPPRSSVSSGSRTRSSRACASASTSCGRWGSAPS